MSERLRGKVAIVTGAGRGIGRAEALQLAAEGARVVVNDLGVAPDGTGSDRSVAETVVAEILAAGGAAAASQATVATAAGAQSIVDTALAAFGRLDILVNNAGVVRNANLIEMTDDDWDTVITINLTGHFMMTRAAARVFVAQRSGRIINTSSESGLGLARQANYSAAKEGVVGFTRTVAQELAPFGITCNAIRPRANTRLTARPESRARRDEVPHESKIGFLLDVVASASPDQVAGLVVYLATDEAAAVTGRDFVVGGGLISLMSPPKEVRTIVAPDGLWTADQLAAFFPVAFPMKSRKAVAPA